MNTIDQAIKATITPTIPYITEVLAVFTASGSPPAVANLKPAMTNIIMKKATAAGQRMLNMASISCPTVRPGTILGGGPGLKAKTENGKASEAIKADEIINFLFIYFPPTNFALIHVLIVYQKSKVSGGWIIFN